LLLVIGIILALYGGTFIKVLLFVGGGLIGASVSFTLLSSRFSGPLLPLGALAGFLVVGSISYGLAYLAFGLLVSSIGFLVIILLVSSLLIAPLVAAVAFTLGVILFNHYLTLATAIGEG
jgi:hypothetical protein